MLSPCLKCRKQTENKNSRENKKNQCFCEVKCEVCNSKKNEIYEREKSKWVIK